VAFLVLFLPACQAALEPIFPPIADAPRWPGPPEPTRVVYVGELRTSEDLKPAVTGLDLVGQFLFGKAEARGMLSPIGVCVDGAGDRLFVADSGAQCVHVFDMKTRKYAAWAPPKGAMAFTQPVAVAWDPAAGGAGAGRLWVADSVSGGVAVFDADGTFAGWHGVGTLRRPVGVAVDAAGGRVFVADVTAHQIVVMDRSGREVRRVGRRGTRLGEFNFPSQVALDPAGRLYVSDALNFRLQQFSPDLVPVRQIGRKGDMPGCFAQPKGVATDSQGHVYVVDSQFENVQLFDDAGRLLMDFGEEGGGRGQFWLPVGVCVDGRDRIWVADSFNKRVQVFDFVKVVEPPETEPATAPAGGGAKPPGTETRP
jgi:DNA-binding beta-propeller fold protein YncE